MIRNNRRNFLTAAFAALFAARTKAQPQPTRSAVKELSRRPLSGAQSGMEAILVEVISQPGIPSNAHRHPGFVMGYVLDGEMKFAIDGKAPETIKAGSTFFEPAGAVHTTGGSANPNAPVRFLAFIVAPTGSPTTLPA